MLAGSDEARALAERLSDCGQPYVAWISEAPRGQAVLPQVPDLHRFADTRQMRAQMTAAGVTRVLDAGHGFDRATTEMAHQAARALDLPFLRVERPPWDIGPPVQMVHDVAAACALVPKGARVFAATGWDSLADFASFRGAHLFLRQTRRHARAAPFPFVSLSFDTPPFDAPGEAALFARLRIDTLICRNLGGPDSFPKVAAARDMGLRVILIDRPALPGGLPTVATPEEAAAWLGV